jgi:hypothetical protein
LKGHWGSMNKGDKKSFFCPLYVFDNYYLVRVSRRIYYKIYSFKGTVAPDLIGLKVVWLNRL